MDTNAAGPSQIPVKELLKCHKDYDPELMDKHRDLFEGGERFEQNKSKYLRWRAIEYTSQGTHQRKARLQAASYTSHVGGLIRFLIAATYSSQPALVPPSGSDNEYYTGLNEDADGAGHSVAEVTRMALEESVVNGRSYLALDFPDPEDAPSLEKQQASGGLDARICFLDAATVDDWAKDDDGNLIFVRTHCIDEIRSSIYGPPDLERHTWTYITPTLTQEYVAERLIKDGKPESWSNNATASGASPKANALGVLPVVEIDAPWVMRSLAPLAISIFNREANLDWSFDVSSFSQLVIKTKKQMGQIISSQNFAMVLDPGGANQQPDSAEYISPDPSHLESQMRWTEKKKEDLYLALQSMILQQSAKDSNGRQSGVAKEMDFSAVAQLLSVFAQAVKNALRNLTLMINAVRGEPELDVKIVGLDKFDVLGLMQKMEIVERVMPLPLPESAKRYAIGDLAASVTAQAPAAVRQQVLEDVASVDLTPAPPENQNDGGPKESGEPPQN
jgi:hypothetical protein